MYARLQRTYIDPADVAHRPACTLQPVDIEALYRPVSTVGMRDQLHRLVVAALNRAMRHRLLTENMARLVRSARKPRPRITPPTPEALREGLWLVERSDAYFHAFVRLAATTGARRGTLVGLQWPDIDLDTGRVTFSRAVARGVGSSSGGYTIKGLKNDRPYAVHLDPGTLAVVRHHRAWCVQRYLRQGQGAAEGWVFPNPHRPAEPMAVDALSQRWRRLRAEVPGLAGARLHDLRHYVATSLFAKGYSPVDVAGRLGHENPSTSLDIYADYLPGRDQAAAVDLAADLAT